MSPTAKLTREQLVQRIQDLEQALEKQSKLRAKLEAIETIAILGYWEHDLVKGILTFNDGFYRLYRTSAEEVGGYTMTTDAYFRRFVHPDDIPRLKEEIKSTAASGDSRSGHQLEHRFLYADGGVGHLLVRFFFLEHQNGRVVKSHGINQDITAIKELEKKLMAITDSARDAILMTTPNGLISFWNPAAEQIFGYTSQEVVGRNLHQLLAPERFLDAYAAAFPDFTRSGTGKAVGQTMSFYARHKDGREVPVELSLSSVSLNGQWHAVGILRDITRRKQTQDALRESEQRFRSLMHLLPEAVFETDRTMHLTFVNQQAYRMFGYKEQDVKKGLHVLDTLIPEDRDRARRNIEKRFRSDALTAQEYTGLRKDGTTFPMLLHANPIMENQQVCGLRGVVVDITDQKKIQEKLLQDQKMKSIGTLAGGIAHDFNNILQPMLGYCTLLKQDLPSDSRLQSYVDVIQSASLRAKELVRQILTFSRQSKHKHTPVRIQQVLQDVFKLSRSIIPSTVEIRRFVQNDCGIVMADATQLQQIVMNLMINAYHAVEKTGGNISVRLNEAELDRKDLDGTMLLPGRYAILSVADTGCGIAPDILDNIFEPYFTTKGHGKGTGLGLAMVYGIVKKHGGEIKVRSQPGRGTTFDVLLPIALADTGPKAPDEPPPCPTGSERILLVDDDDMVRETCATMLERLGYHVTACSGSADALKTYRKTPEDFDLVITDMTMPWMTGAQLSKELLAIDPTLPIILCTGYSDKIDPAAASAMGIKAFLLKPLSLPSLSQQVRAVLDDGSDAPSPRQSRPKETR